MAEKPSHPPTGASGKSGSHSSADEMAQAEKILAGSEKDAPKKEEAHGAPAGGTKKKKKKGKKASGPSIGVRLKSASATARVWFVDLFKSVASPDAPTRRMAVFFFLSLFGVVALGVMVVKRNARLEQERLAVAAIQAKEAEERSAEAALLGGHETAESGHASSMLNLGLFTIALKPVGERPKSGSFVNMAEVEIFAECDSKETHEFLEENLAQARNQLNGVFLSVDREELLTREGKRKLKKRVLELLNGWLPHGKIRGIFFSKLIVA